MRLKVTSERITLQLRKKKKKNTTDEIIKRTNARDNTQNLLNLFMEKQ